MGDFHESDEYVKLCEDIESVKLEESVECDDPYDSDESTDWEYKLELSAVP